MAPGDEVDARVPHADDVSALEALYRTLYTSVYGFVWRRTGNTSVTDEIVAEVLTLAWSKIGQLRHLPDRVVQVWLWRAATFIGLRSHQAASRHRALVERLRTEPIPTEAGGFDDDTDDTSAGGPADDAVHRALLTTGRDRGGLGRRHGRRRCGEVTHQPPEATWTRTLAVRRRHRHVARGRRRPMHRHGHDTTNHYLVVGAPFSF